VKMSKSKGNVINPDAVIQEYGADTLRCYEMFMGPFEQAIAWDTQGVKGVRRFLEKVWRLKLKVKNQKSKLKIKNQKLNFLLHKTIKKVSEDIESLKFNTAIASLMILANEMEKEKEIPQKLFSTFLILLSPFAPHLTEELWHQLGYKKSIFLQKWPKYDPKMITEERVTIVVQVNGKVRDKIETEKGISKEQAVKLVLAREKIKKWVDQKRIEKTIFIPDRLINFVVK